MPTMAKMNEPPPQVEVTWKQRYYTTEEQAPNQRAEETASRAIAEVFPLQPVPIHATSSAHTVTTAPK
jgi:hypothetical protein